MLPGRLMTVVMVFLFGLLFALSAEKVEADEVAPVEAGTAEVGTAVSEGGNAVPVDGNSTESSTAQSLNQEAPVTALTEVQRQRLTSLEAKPLHQFSNVELDEYLQLDSRNREITRQAGSVTSVSTPATRIKLFATRALQQPYRKHAMQYDLTEGDCVVAVQRWIALSLSRNWNTYYKITERLMHKDGVIQYTNRNFLTLSDWIPSNAWLLRDVTTTLVTDGQTPVQGFTLVVRPKKFVEVPTSGGGTRMSFVGCDYASPQKEIRTEYFVPRDHVQEVFPYLCDGDVCLIIRKYTKKGLAPWYDCDHMGVLAKDAAGVVSLIHSSPPSVRQEKLLQFQTINPFVAGYKFLRLRDDAANQVSSELNRVGTAIPQKAPVDLDSKNLRYRPLRQPTTRPVDTRPTGLPPPGVTTRPVLIQNPVILGPSSHQ